MTTNCNLSAKLLYRICEKLDNEPKMIMKMKITAVVTAWLAAGAFSAFGQAYVSFVTPGKYVYDEFTMPGTDVPAPGNVDVAFLWAAVGTTDPLGAGIPTTGSNSGGAGAGSTGLISQMLGSGWTEGYNYNGGSPIEAVTAVVDNGPAVGGIAYNDATYFQLNGTTPGDAYEIVVVGWDNEGETVNSLSTALTDGGALGWSGSFTYQTGAAYTDPVPTFDFAGMTPFGVAAVPGGTDPVPEPTSLALGGLAGLSMFFFLRRRQG